MAQPHATEHPDADPCKFTCQRDDILRTMQAHQHMLEERLSRTEEMIETLMVKAGMQPPPKPLKSPTPQFQNHA